MNLKKKLAIYGIAAGGVLLILLWGWASRNWVIAAPLAACVALVANGWSRFRRTRTARGSEPPARAASSGKKESPATKSFQSTSYSNDPPQDMDSYVQLLMAQGRHMLLLRPQIAKNLKPKQLEKAVSAMQEEMALVPDGDVLLAHPEFNGDDEVATGRGQTIAVQAFYLDRYPVTNRQFKRFVDSGGYEDSALWDPTILAGVLDFVDETGQLAPRFWRDATFPEELADHPVVGVSWYEASAYARWVGKRSPTDPEWVKAASWPVSTTGSRPQQRRYPWGNSMDNNRANLWASGPGTTVSVAEYPDGVSVGGVYHLVGNVWEWTTGNFGTWHPSERKIESTDTYKSLRGGAFDTYFDGHAVCQFQSGDHPLVRKHNIGFRCALGMCDVSPLALQMQS